MVVMPTGLTVTPSMQSCDTDCPGYSEGYSAGPRPLVQFRVACGKIVLLGGATLLSMAAPAP